MPCILSIITIFTYISIHCWKRKRKKHLWRKRALNFYLKKITLLFIFVSRRNLYFLKYTLTMACSNDLYWQFWRVIPSLTADRFMSATVISVFLSFFPFVACHEPDTLFSRNFQLVCVPRLDNYYDTYDTRTIFFWMFFLPILKLALVCKYDQTNFSKIVCFKIVEKKCFCKIFGE